MAANIMLEQFFKYETNHEVFADYDVCQAWARDMLLESKFVWAVAEEVSISSLCPAHKCHPFLRTSGAV